MTTICTTPARRFSFLRRATVAIGLALGITATSLPASEAAAADLTYTIAGVTVTAPNWGSKVAVWTALAQRGDPYVYGGSGPYSFDCSGLTSYSWRRAGNRGIPRTSSAQYAWTSSVGWSGKLPGDLLFYSGHVAMYVGYSSGGYWMMEAPHSGLTVRLVPARTTGLRKVGRVRW